MIYFGYPLDMHGWKPKPETEPETKPKPEPENRGRKPTPNPKPEKPKPADTRTKPDPLPSLAGTALQLSVRRGTASEDGACGNDKVGRHGLQRIVAGGPATLWLLRCGPSSEDSTSDNLACWHGDEGCTREWGDSAV